MDEEDLQEDLKIKERYVKCLEKEQRLQEELIKLDQLRELSEAINKKKEHVESVQEKKKRVRAFLIKRGIKHQKLSRLNLETLQKLQFDVNYEEADQYLEDISEAERFDLSIKISMGELSHEDIADFVKTRRK